jgi:hypothetical protein
MPNNYSWTPEDPEIVHTGAADPDEVIPAGFVRQSAWSSLAQSPPEARPPDLHGVYMEPIPATDPDWEPVVWRWADTWRRDSVQRAITSGGFPVYRFEVSQCDKASPGTSGDHPRAELLSVDPAEKRRQRTAADGLLGSLSDGDEYWATFAIFIPSDFPDNHNWATLFQRKLDDRYFATPKHPSVPKDLKFMTWFTINVHRRSAGTQVDASIPGYPAFPGQPGGAADDVKICDLADIAGRWAQFTVHEKLSSSGTDGEADVRLQVGSTDKRVPVAPKPATTFPAADANFTPARDVTGHFQYGYYRDNGPARNVALRPGTGVAYYTPLMFSRSGVNAPQLP